MMAIKPKKTSIITQRVTSALSISTFVMQNSTESVAERITAYQKAGINCLPALGKKGIPLGRPKAPDGGSRKLLIIRQNAADYSRILKSAPKSIGIFCGITCGIEALDFDQIEAFEAFLKFAKKAGLEALTRRIAKGYEERTPRGIHWLYRINLKTQLAFPSNQRWATAEGKPIIETRGQGGYCITAPSWNNIYRQTQGGPGSIVTIDWDEREQLRSIGAMLGDSEPTSIITKPTIRKKTQRRPTN